MSPSTRLVAVVGVGSLAVAVASMALGSKLVRWMQKPKNPEEVERLRRLAVNRTGRITSGQVVDLIEEGSARKQGRVVVYRYQVGGVTYEAAQEISGFAEFPSTGFAGLSSSVKYDPQKPMNSIVACEEWNGLGIGSGR